MRPVLFNIFINGLLVIVDCDMYNYADDNTIAEIDMEVDILMCKL